MNNSNSREGVDIYTARNRNLCGIQDPINNIKWLNALFYNLADTLNYHFGIKKSRRFNKIRFQFYGWKLSETTENTHILVSVYDYGYNIFKSGFYLYDFNGNFIGSYCSLSNLFEGLEITYGKLPPPKYEMMGNAFYIENYWFLGFIITKITETFDCQY